MQTLEWKRRVERLQVLRSEKRRPQLERKRVSFLDALDLRIPPYIAPPLIVVNGVRPRHTERVGEYPKEEGTRRQSMRADCSL